MSKADTDWIISSLELLGSSVESDFEQNCFAVAGNVATARTNVKACVRTASLFWALERYQEAAKLVESLAAQAKKTRGSEPVPSGLRLMRAAARMRSKHGLLPQEKGRLLKELRAERSKIHDPEERGVYYLGLGYVIYSHWREVVRNDSADSDSARSLAQECFDLGNEAVSLLSKGKNKLAYAFALNHRAYSVATMGTPAADAWQRYFQPLLDLKDQIRDVWHARFDDTIGVYYLGEVKKHLAALDPEQGSLKSAEEAAQHAQEFLDDAQLGNTGGIDLEAHQNELIDLRRQIVERRRQWKEAVS